MSAIASILVPQLQEGLPLDTKLVKPMSFTNNQGITLTGDVAPPAQPMEEVPLKRSTLAKIKSPVHTPLYDVSQVSPGIVHLGFGGFHRAHMCRYTHNLMDLNKKDPAALGWGIIGAGLLPNDKKMKECMEPQDNLYTLVERSGTDEVATIIGCVSDVIFAADDVSKLLTAIDNPSIKIVSSTVTEFGYCLDRVTFKLDMKHAGIVKDLANKDLPTTAIGIITAAYSRRRAAGLPAFTAMSCDNIQHNGLILENAVHDYAQALDPSLAEWIQKNASFPSTMVDRITPVTQPTNISHLLSTYGIADKWPVYCESFLQWVIEDNFVNGRPNWEAVGAQFVKDVEPYEFMKLRLLNASHLAIAGLGQLCGYTYIHETMQDERIARYMRALMDRETGPTLRPVPGIDLEVYKETLLGRFANPEVKDTVQRVNTDAPLPTLIDSTKDRLAKDESIEFLALAIAAWLRRAKGKDEKGRDIPIHHPLAEKLIELAHEGGSNPRPLLSLASLFGDLGNDPRFLEPVERWLVMLYEDGASKTLDTAVKTLKF